MTQNVNCVYDGSIGCIWFGMEWITVFGQFIFFNMAGLHVLSWRATGPHFVGRQDILPGFYLDFA
jgi:hypothetical protein